MGPRSENRGYVGTVSLPFFGHDAASMGPRSENRGYGSCVDWLVETGHWLQWVHGPRTVVMSKRPVRSSHYVDASMGPRSENRGYASTVRLTSWRSRAASMGPRSENRGYVKQHREAAADWRLALQWVHGPRTVVMARCSKA